MHKKIAIFLLFFFSINTSIAEPIGLYAAKETVKQYYISGLYQREFNKVIEQAIHFIHTRAHYAHNKLALILDIDETSLSNYPYMLTQDFGYQHERFHEHVLQANDPALAATLRLFHEARALGISVFFITGRPQTEAKATEINLQTAGYQGWQKIFYKPTKYSQNSVVPFKAGVRKEIEASGYRIIASVGDQVSDYAGGYTEKGFKLPNPWYFIA